MLSDFPKVSQLIRGNPPQRLLVIGKWKLFYWDSKRGRASHTCVYIQTHVYTHTYSFYYLFIWLCCVLVVAYTDPSRLRVGSVVVAGGLHYPKVCGILVPPPGIKPTSPALEGRFLTTGLPGKPHIGTPESSSLYCHISLELASPSF